MEIILLFWLTEYIYTFIKIISRNHLEIKSDELNAGFFYIVSIKSCYVLFDRLINLGSRASKSLQRHYISLFKLYGWWNFLHANPNFKSFFFLCHSYLQSCQRVNESSLYFHETLHKHKYNCHVSQHNILHAK